MNTKHLNFFVAAVDEGSITAAADRCFVTQPTLSAGLTSLERELGGKLIERSRSGIYLTDLGARVLTQAREILHRVNEIKVSQQITTQKAFTLAICNTVNPSHYEKIFGLLRQNGFSNFRILDVDHNTGASALAKGRASALVTTSLEYAPNSTATKVAEEPYGILLHRTHSLNRKKVLRRIDLDGLPIIVRVHSEETKIATDLLRQAKSKPKVISRVNSDSMACALVENNLGVCLAPTSIIEVFNQADLLRWKPVQGVNLSRKTVIYSN